MRGCLLFLVISLCFVSFAEIKTEGDSNGKEPTALSKLSPEDREALLKYLKELAPQSGARWLGLSNATITAFSTLGTVFTTSVAWACYHWKTNPVALANLALASFNAWVCSKTRRDVKKVCQDLKALRAEALSNQERLRANLERFQQGNGEQHRNFSQQLVDFGQDLTAIKGEAARINLILGVIQTDIGVIKKDGVTTEGLRQELAAHVATLATREDTQRIEGKIDSLKGK